MKQKKRSITEKTINIILNILVTIFSIILLISIYTGIQVKLLGHDYADFFGYSIFEVQTGSMADAINIGDWIIVSNTNNIKLNDVITYKHDGEYITHRVIEAYQNTYITKGDANSSKDKPINKKQIIGKVVKNLGKIGLIRRVLFNPPVLIALIITLFLINLTFSKKENQLTKAKEIIHKYKKKIKNKRIKQQEKEVEKIIKPEMIIEPLTKREPIKQEEQSSKTFSEFESDLTNEELEDELDKTMIFRVIPVDSSEIDNTLLEIAQNELNETKPHSKQKQSIKQEEETTTISQNKIEEITKKSNKKSKNVVNKAMSIKTEELHELVSVLELDKLQVNEATIKNIFVNNYIDAKYYNKYKDSKLSDKKKLLKIENQMNETAKELIKEYKGSDQKYNFKVEKYQNIFLLIANLEQAKDQINDSNAKKEFYKEQVSNYLEKTNQELEMTNSIIERIMKIQQNYIGIIEYFLKKLETNMFKLVFNQLNTKKDIYGLELQHNISFDKVYSDYIIDKTYNEGIIAEDKMTILLNLLSIQLVHDMISGEFGKKYLLYIPKSLYAKESKLNKILEIIEDEYAKDNIIIMVTYEELLGKIKQIQKIKKQDYKFAITFNKNVKIKSEDMGKIYIANYLFVDKKKVEINQIIPHLQEELEESIIYENIANKVGDFEVNE